MEEKTMDMIPEEEVNVEEKIVAEESIPGVILFAAGAAVATVTITVGKKLFGLVSDKYHDWRHGSKTVTYKDVESDEDAAESDSEEND